MTSVDGHPYLDPKNNASKGMCPTPKKVTLKKSPGGLAAMLKKPKKGVR